MSSRVTAVCDICGTEQELKVGAPIDSYEWDQQLRMEGWWSRPDFDEICPAHPQPAAVLGDPE
jgi:hypothetical protein